MEFGLIGLLCSGLLLILNEHQDDIIKNFSYFKDYCKGLTHKQQFKESFKKNFAITGTEMINFLKNPRYYYVSNRSYINLFDNIIKNQINFDLNYLCDFYFNLEDKKDAIIICLCPFRNLLKLIECTTFFRDFSIEKYYEYGDLEAKYYEYGVSDLETVECLKQNIVMLNFRSHIFGSFKIPVFYRENYDGDHKVILTTKHGNKSFVFNCLHERDYGLPFGLAKLPENSPFIINLKTKEQHDGII